jgi:hypothetical protein
MSALEYAYFFGTVLKKILLCNYDKMRYLVTLTISIFITTAAATTTTTTN